MIDKLDAKHILVLDADAIWILTQMQKNKIQELCLKKAAKIIITPNQVEFEKLSEALLDKNYKPATKEEQSTQLL